MLPIHRRKRQAIRLDIAQHLRRRDLKMVARRHADRLDLPLPDQPADRRIRNAEQLAHGTGRQVLGRDNGHGR